LQEIAIVDFLVANSNHIGDSNVKFNNFKHFYIQMYSQFCIESLIISVDYREDIIIKLTKAFIRLLYGLSYSSLCEYQVTYKSL